jgi:hypothetical protein
MIRPAIPFSGQVLSLVFDGELNAVVECKEIDLAAGFAPLLPKLDHKAQTTEFGGLALSEDGMSGVMVFARARDDEYRPGKPRQFVVVFEPRQGVVLRTILVKKDFVQQLDFLYPFRFDQNSILFGLPGKAAGQLSLSLVKCDITEDGLQFEDKQREYLIDNMRYMADSKGRLQEGMHSVACLVDDERLLIKMPGSQGRPKKLEIGVPGDAPVEFVEMCGRFEGLEIANVFERSIREFGVSAIWIANCGFIPQEYLKLSIHVKSQSNGNDDQLLSALRKRIGQHVVLENLNTLPNYPSYRSREIPWTSLFIKFCSVPEVVVMAPTASDDAFARRQCTAFVPALLAALPTGQCFSVSYVGINGTGIISSLSGMEFTCRRNRTMSVGSTVLPVVAKAAAGLIDSFARFKTADVRSLVNVVGSLFTVSGATAQAIGFIAAVSMSNVVIVEVEDLKEFWKEVQFSCDFVMCKFGLSFSVAEVEVFVIGSEELEIGGIPRTSSVHCLCEKCKFQNVDRSDVDKVIGGSMKIGSSLQVTSNFVGYLRKSCGLFGNFVDVGSAMISMRDVFELSEEYRRRGDICKSEWLCRQSAQKGYSEARYSLCESYRIEKSERSSLLEDLALSGHVGSAWLLFKEDKSRIDCFNNCVSHGHVEAMIEKAGAIGGPGAIDILFEVAKSGNEVANELLYEYRSDFVGEVADWQSRYWLSRDAWKSYLCYEIAKKQIGQDFCHYRRILNSLSRQYREPSDLSAEGLRRSLDSGNKLAAVHLAELIKNEDAKKAVLSEGLPSRPAFFALAMIYLGKNEPAYDVIYECYRDGILADESITPESIEAQEMLMDFFRGDMGPVNNRPEIRLELARFLTDPADNSFSKDADSIRTFPPTDSDLPEYSVIWASLEYNHLKRGRRSDFTRPIQVCEAALRKWPGCGRIEFLLSQMVTKDQDRLLQAAAEHGCPEAQVWHAVSSLKKPDVPASERGLIIHCLKANSSDNPVCRFYLALFMAVGEWGVQKDLEAARELCSSVQLEQMPTVTIDTLQPGLSFLIQCQIMASRDDADFVKNLLYGAKLVPDDDPEMKVVYFAQVYLNPRVNAFKIAPIGQMPEELLERLEGSEPGKELAAQLAEKYFESGGVAKAGRMAQRLQALRGK